MRRLLPAITFGAMGLATILAFGGCSSVKGGIAMLTSSSPPPVVSDESQEHLSQEVSSLIDYAMKKQPYYSVVEGDTIHVFEQEIAEINSLLNSDDHAYHFLINTLNSQYYRREKLFPEAERGLNNAFFDLASLLGEEKITLDELVRTKTPFDFSQVLWLYHDESALYLLDAIKADQSPVPVPEAIGLAHQHFERCLELAPAGRQAIAINYFQRPQLEKIEKKYLTN